MKTLTTILLLFISLLVSGQSPQVKSLSGRGLYIVSNSTYRDTVQAGVLIIDSIPGYYTKLQTDAILLQLNQAHIDSFALLRALLPGVAPNCEVYNIQTLTNNTILTECCGYITDGSGDYSATINNTLVISNAGTVDHITIDFTSFDVELDYDFIYIYDGNDNLLYTYTGTSIPTFLSLDYPVIKIRFYSDSSTQGTGFYLRYQVYNTPTTSLCY